jgi:hypothetical protein
LKLPWLERILAYHNVEFVGFKQKKGWLWQVGEVLDNPLGERGSGLQGRTTGEGCWLGSGRSRDVPFIVIYVLYNGLRENIIY